ncbi:hypothetical protein PCASD_15779 [Puccinia coronata f. sp. avenae]|uniref:Uncharacterized protein n=1 Tax=Puccinia coronata f. sp. avenae TaxID=200324 RepID=A0A2N5TWZ9_9BASI|nr:hypothetical protein PCASD_15779 [Puccinia coronata f. sp. avenae]
MQINRSSISLSDQAEQLAFPSSGFNFRVGKHSTHRDIRVIIQAHQHKPPPQHPNLKQVPPIGGPGNWAGAKSPRSGSLRRSTLHYRGFCQASPAPRAQHRSDITCPVANV